MTREQEFREVRRLLDNPKEQRPSPDLILSALFREEQFMLNKLNGTGRSWTEDSLVIITVANQPDYELVPTTDTGSAFGKALYVYRDFGNNILVPVPFTDQDSELMNQSYEFVSVPLKTGMIPPVTGTKIAFYRTTAGVKRARIYPTPEDVKTFHVIYATGALDWSDFTWCDTPIMPEWSSLRCLTVATFLLPQCEWNGLDASGNIERQKALSMSLQPQVQRQEPEYNDYLRNPQHDISIDMIGAWYDA